MGERLRFAAMSLLRATHVGICVSDIERSLRFYRDLLGFRFLSEIEMAGEPAATLLRLPDAEFRAVYLERDGLRIELLCYAHPGHAGGGSPRAMNRLGITHLSFRVDDLAAMLPELERAGVRLLRETYIDFSAMDAGAIFVTDPDGTLIELVQAPGDPATPPGA